MSDRLTRAPSAPAEPVGVALWERAAAALCLMQLSEPFLGAWYLAQGIEEPPAAVRLIWAPVYCFLAFVGLRDWRAAVGLAPRMGLLLALCALSVLSAAWSIAPGDTLRRSFGLLVAVAFGAYLAWRYPWRELLGVLGLAWAGLIAGAYLVPLTMAPMGVMQVEHPGAWAGLWTHKNSLAAVMAVGLGALAAAGVADPARRVVWAGLGLLAGGLIVLATGMTAALAACAGVGVIGLILGVRRGPVTTVVLGAAIASAAVIVGIWMALAPETVVALIGRDLTFTGRTDIWEAVAAALAERPWFGHGYGAFWLDDRGPSFWVQRAVGWQVETAHNGFLEVQLGLGRLGLGLVLAQLALTLWRALRSRLGLEAIWAPAFLAAFVIYAWAESYILTQSLFWALYVTVSAKLAMSCQRAQTPR